MLGEQPAAITDEERRDPQPRRETRFGDAVEQRLHAARELRLDLEPVAHFRGEPVIDLEDVERDLALRRGMIAAAARCSRIEASSIAA